MKTISQYITEALIKKNTKIFNNENTDNLVDDICDHLLVRITNHDNDKKCKEIIKQWIIENNVYEVEYWTTTYWLDIIKNNPSRRNNINLSDFHHEATVTDITGFDFEERRKDKEIEVSFLTSIYLNKKYICFYSGFGIYAIKKL